MKKSTVLLLILSIFITNISVSQNFNYEKFANDPLNARIYTLDNGLKVYMSVSDETPRIQTYIAVRVGAKNDPSETTGLAHYFEHLMFKGTKKYGTTDYEKEKPLLDEIERLFEIYRNTSDEDSRKELYKQIDSVSYQASLLSIPNEYDKLMTAIGASGTNAYTAMDMTVYTENIPSNQIENWAKIQSDRFQNNVIRGFHTELETVYEEKNMSLTRDNRKVYEKVLALLFPHHPYGQQTVLGSQEHLKNPSITNIKNYYKTYYVPNNMAICVAGDFNPDEMIRIIDKYFGALKPNPNLPKLNVSDINKNAKPRVEEVFGLEAENVTIAWSAGGNNTEDADMLNIISWILNNGKAGLIDLNLLQKQKVLSAYSGAYSMTDHSAFVLNATPKESQTLEQAKDLLLAEIEKLKSGDYPDELISATINNMKLNEMRRIENISARANWFVNSFINNTNWNDEITKIDRLSKISKEQISNFAKTKFADNYIVIYKRKGKDPSELKIDKPSITPIATNRDASSKFLNQIQDEVVTPIEPVFVDYQKDMKVLSAKSSIPVLYKQNKTNGVFSLSYIFEMGKNHDKLLDIAFTYLNYIGTSKKSREQFNQEMFNLACSFSVNAGNRRVYVNLSGLADNMDKAIILFEELLNNPQVNQEAFTNLVSDILKERENGKLNQMVNFSRLLNYSIYGANNPSNNVISESELKSMDPKNLIAKIKNLNSYEHTIMYYGPATETKLLSTVNLLHKTPAKLNPIDLKDPFKMQETPNNKVYIAEYDSKQIYMGMFTNYKNFYDKTMQPTLSLYNEYFGGGMNAIVFQEMRESRGLAYSASAYINSPTRLDIPYYYQTFIATQIDKMIDAISAFNSIINEMPISENAFKLAKDGLINRIRTERITKEQVLWSYLSAKELGLNVDLRKDLFEKTPSLKLEDIKKFQEEWVKNKKYTYFILGKESDLDLKNLEKYGNIQKISQKELFGY